MIRRRLIWLLLVVSAGATVNADGPDRIRYTPERPRPIGQARERSDAWIPQPLVTVVGTIQEFDHQWLEISPEDGDEPLRLPSDRLLLVDPGWEDPDAVAGLEAYERAEYQEAIPPFLEAVKRRPAAWRQQWLSVRMAVAAFEAGRYPAVLELVAQLDRTDLPAVMIGQLPIQWHSASRDPQLAAAAKTKLAAPEPLARLVAASVLFGRADSATAETTLKQLSQDATHPLLARLADALLWRQTPPPDIEKELPRWEQKIEALPIAVRWGPMMVIADRLQAAGDKEHALEWWLAAGLLAPEAEHPEAGRARRQAAQLLEQMGLSAEGLEPAVPE